MNEISRDECVRFFQLKEEFETEQERMLVRIDNVIERIIAICGNCDPWEWTWEFQDTIPHEELGKIESKDDIIPVVVIFNSEEKTEKEDESMYDSYMEQDDAYEVLNAIFSSLFGFEDNRFYIDLKYKDLENDDFEKEWEELVKKVREGVNG